MIFLDIETLDFFQDAHIKTLPRPVQLCAMRFGLATTYDDASGTWTSYWPEERWPREADEVTGTPSAIFTLWSTLISKTVVGWNIFDFDIPYLMLHLKLLGYEDDPWLHPMQIIDLMALCKEASEPYGRARWYSLRDIAAANGLAKTANGQEAAEWLRSGTAAQARLAAAYCRNDVQLCVDLLALAQGGGLLLPARPERNERGNLRLFLDERGQLRECVKESTNA